MLFITGDTHGGYDPDARKLMSFKAKSENLTKDDYLIIAGDFGFIRYKEKTYHETKWLKFFDNLKCTTLFIDGNHENFARLNSYEVSEFAGSMVHRISDSVYHLMCGEVFELDNRKIFTMGGALSIDKEYRIPGKSWWKEEAISQNDMQNAWANLAKHNNEIDIIITHTCPDHIVKDLRFYSSQRLLDEANLHLEKIYAKVKFDKWYFWHFHQDKVINDKFRALYNEIVGV